MEEAARVCVRRRGVAARRNAILISGVVIFNENGKIELIEIYRKIIVIMCILEKNLFIEK